MQFMLLIYSDENSWTQAEIDECLTQSLAICDELEEAGKYISAAPLKSVSTATSLRIRNNQCEITDGPFAETREQLGGYYIIDVEHLDEAIEIAKRLPPAKKGTVEIRPIEML